jgi:ribA/ribD-fused uncharacterized protein
VNNIAENSIPSLEKSVADIYLSLDDIKSNAEKHNVTVGNLDVKIKDMEDENLSLRRELNDTKSRMLYLESQSRRNNLLFQGFEDKAGETWDQSEGLVVQYLSTYLGITVKHIERAHRIGKFKQGASRPIVVKFLLFKERQTVWSKKFDILEDLSVGEQEDMPNIKIFEDYPAEVTANRKKLWPYFKAAKELNLKNVSLKLDKLWIDGKMFTVETLHTVPECLLPHHRCHKQTDDVFVFLTKHSILSNFHPKEVKIEGVAYSCNEQFFQRSKALLFGDHETAEKILNEKDPAKMHEFGKRVRGFNKEIWKKRAPRVLKHMNEVKFRSYPEAATFLVNTGERRIGEGSPDPYYGIGIHISSPAATDQTKWNGTNLMGTILTEIRDSLNTS